MPAFFVPLRYRLLSNQDNRGYATHKYMNRITVQTCPNNTVAGIISCAPTQVNKKTSAINTQKRRSDRTRNFGDPICTVLKKGRLTKLKKVSAMATTPIALLGILRRIA